MNLIQSCNIYVQFLCQEKRRKRRQSLHWKCHKEGSGGKFWSCSSGPILTLWEISHLDLNPKSWLSSALNIKSSNSLTLHPLWSTVTPLGMLNLVCQRAAIWNARGKKNEGDLSKVMCYKMKIPKYVTRAFEHVNWACRVHMTWLWNLSLEWPKSNQKSKIWHICIKIYAPRQGVQSNSKDPELENSVSSPLLRPTSLPVRPGHGSRRK